MDFKNQDQINIFEQQRGSNVMNSSSGDYGFSQGPETYKTSRNVSRNKQNLIANASLFDHGFISSGTCTQPQSKRLSVSTANFDEQIRDNAPPASAMMYYASRHNTTYNSSKPLVSQTPEMPLSPHFVTAPQIQSYLPQQQQ